MAKKKNTYGDLNAILINLSTRFFTSQSLNETVRLVKLENQKRLDNEARALRNTKNLKIKELKKKNESLKKTNYINSFETLRLRYRCLYLQKRFQISQLEDECTFQHNNSNTLNQHETQYSDNTLFKKHGNCLKTGNTSSTVSPDSNTNRSDRTLHATSYTTQGYQPSGNQSAGNGGNGNEENDSRKDAISGGNYKISKKNKKIFKEYTKEVIGVGVATVIFRQRHIILHRLAGSPVSLYMHEVMNRLYQRSLRSELNTRINALMTHRASASSQYFTHFARFTSRTFPTLQHAFTFGAGLAFDTSSLNIFLRGAHFAYSSLTFQEIIHDMRNSASHHFSESYSNFISIMWTIWDLLTNALDQIFNLFIEWARYVDPAELSWLTQISSRNDLRTLFYHLFFTNVLEINIGMSERFTLTSNHFVTLLNTALSRLPISLQNLTYLARWILDLARSSLRNDSQIPNIYIFITQCFQKLIDMFKILRDRAANSTSFFKKK